MNGDKEYMLERARQLADSLGEFMDKGIDAMSTEIESTNRKKLNTFMGEKLAKHLSEKTQDEC